MLESRKFTYAGESSDDYGVELVYESAGTLNESLFSNRSIVTENVPNRDIPIFKRVNTTPLTIDMTIWVRDWQIRNNIRAITRWLRKDTYQPLIFESNTDQIYYAICVGEPVITHNGNQEGTIKFQMICDSPFAYSSPKIDMLSVRGIEKRLYFNEGDVRIRPQLILTKQNSDGDIKIKNERNGQELILTNIYNNEVIRINCENEEITSSLENVSNRYIIEQHNDVWLDFDFNFFEANEFTFEGDFDCEFVFEYRYLNQDRPIYFDEI